MSSRATGDAVPPKRCDVAVAGGGPAGATIARVLAAWGMSVVVIDASVDVRKAGEILGPEASRILDVLELSALLENSPLVAARCDGVVTHWSNADTERDDYEFRAARHGWAIARPALHAKLRELAVASSAQWLARSKVVRVHRQKNDYALEIATQVHPFVLIATFVIDATGRAASIARRLGAQRRVDDTLVAAAFSVSPRATEADSFMHLTATADGWWYSSVGPGGEQRTAFVTDPSLPSGVRPALVATAQRMTEQRVTPVLLDASSACLDCCASDRWLAIGDAATAFDPFCGQGLSNAFGSALAGAHAIRECAANRMDAFAAYADAARRTYAHSRRQLNVRYSHIARRFGGRFWEKRAGRSTTPS